MTNCSKNQVKTTPFYKYRRTVYNSQTWVNDHLWTATICLQQLLFLVSHFQFLKQPPPVNSNQKFEVPRIVNSNGIRYHSLFVIKKKFFKNRHLMLLLMRRGGRGEDVHGGSSVWSELDLMQSSGSFVRCFHRRSQSGVSHWSSTVLGLKQKCLKNVTKVSQKCHEMSLIVSLQTFNKSNLYTMGIYGIKNNSLSTKISKHVI